MMPYKYQLHLKAQDTAGMLPSLQKSQMKKQEITWEINYSKMLQHWTLSLYLTTADFLF